MVTFAYLSDRLQSRGILLAISSAIGGLGYLYANIFSHSLKFLGQLKLTLCRLLLVVPDNVHARYFATFCITGGSYTGIGLTLAWCKSRLCLRLAFIEDLWITVGHNLGSETKRATGLPLFMAIGQCGSILGSHIYPQTEGPRYM